MVCDFFICHPFHDTPYNFSFLKNVLISERNFVILYAGIGIVSLFVWYPKDAHFLRHMQDPNVFF